MDSSGVSGVSPRERADFEAQRPCRPRRRTARWITRAPGRAPRRLSRNPAAPSSRSRAHVTRGAGRRGRRPALRAAPCAATRSRATHAPTTARRPRGRNSARVGSTLRTRCRAADAFAHRRAVIGLRRRDQRPGHGPRRLAEPQADATVARGKCNQDARLVSRAQQQMRGDRPLAQEAVEVVPFVDAKRERRRFGAIGQPGGRDQSVQEGREFPEFREHAGGVCRHGRAPRYQNSRHLRFAGPAWATECTGGAPAR